MALTISGSGGGVTASDVLTMLNGYGKVENDTYTGTGTTGSANPTSLTFDGDPCLVVIRSVDYTYVRYLIFFPIMYTNSFVARDVIQIGPAASTSGYVSDTYFAKYDSSTKTLSWYTTTSGNASYYQMNRNGATYKWFAITK